MKMRILLLGLLVFSAATIATVSIASSVSLPALANQTETVLFDTNFGDIEPNGDPVEGGGGGPGFGGGG